MHLARRFSPVLAAIFAFVVAAAVFGSVAPPAQAHDGLATSSPAADAVLDVAPTEITLSFTGNILGDAGANAVIVTDASVAQVQSGTVSVDGAVVTQPLTPELENGAFTVTWRVVSSDGHPISGEYVFHVDAPAPAPSAAPTESAAPSAAPVESPSADVTATPLDGPTTGQPGEQSDGGLSPWGIAGIVVAVLAVVALTIGIIRYRAQRRQQS